MESRKGITDKKDRGEKDRKRQTKPFQLGKGKKKVLNMRWQGGFFRITSQSGSQSGKK